MSEFIVEESVLQTVSGAEMWKHLEHLVAINRTSGTEGENEAIAYIVDVLKRFGLPVEVYEFDAYLSYPIAATLQTVGAQPESFLAKTRAFSGSTPTEGVEGEIVYVPGGKDMFRDFETIRRLEALDLRDKIVLSEGGGRQNMLLAQEKGAVGYLHMWPSDEEQLHEGIVTPVWGTPTPDTFPNIPTIPVATVNNAAGRRLRELSTERPVRVRLTTSVETGWRTVRLPVTTIKGQTDDFVLAAGHIDSWHLGATDNATGNVACLEIARVLSQQRADLIRGVKIAWWPGHSTGRYAGSAWFADNFWQQLHEHCITYVNIDSPGSLGATEYRLITAVAENAQFAIETIKHVTGQTPVWERPVRAGDQSFWGAGIPSLYMLLSERPQEQSAMVGGCGGGWWWHTEEDTLDKVGLDVLVTDTRIHLLAILRLCTMDVLPFRIEDLAAELGEIVADLKAESGERFDLRAVDAEVARLSDAATRLRQRLEAVDVTSREHSQAADVFNRAALRAIKAITPVSYTRTGQFDHDPAIPTPALPGMEQLPKLTQLDPESDEFRFLVTQLVRERNRVIAAVRQATAAIENAQQAMDALAGSV